MEKIFLEEKTQKGDRFHRGRHIASIICKSLNVTGIQESIADVSDLMEVTLRGDDILGIDTR